MQSAYILYGDQVDTIFLSIFNFWHFQPKGGREQVGGGRYNDAVAHALLLAPHCKPSHTGICILLYQHQHNRELMLILSSWRSGCWWSWFQGGWLLLTRMKSLGGKQDDDYSRWPRSEIRSLMVSFSGYSWRKCPTLTTSWFFQTCLPPKMGPSTISLVNQY